jgi:hypothetical protein
VDQPGCETTAAGGGVCAYTIAANATNTNNITAKITMGGAFAQEFLVIDADADEQNLLTITFPHAMAAHKISFPEETGEILTTASKFSTLAAVGDVSIGNLVEVKEACVATDPAALTAVKNLCLAADISVTDVATSKTNCQNAAAGACTYTAFEAFGTATVTSLAVTTGSEFKGGTTIGDDTDDAIAFHGFFSTDHLIFDTDVDSQCLTLMFADPKTDYSFSGTEDLNGDGVTDTFVDVAIVIENLVSYDTPEDFSWTLDQVTLAVAESCNATSPTASQAVKDSCSTANIAGDVTASTANCLAANSGTGCSYTAAVEFSSTNVLSAQGLPRSVDPTQQVLQGSIKLLPDGRYYRFTIRDSGAAQDGIVPPGAVKISRDGVLLGDANVAAQTGGDNYGSNVDTRVTLGVPPNQVANPSFGKVLAFGANVLAGLPYADWSLTFRAGSSPYYDKGVDEYCAATNPDETNPVVVSTCNNADTSDPDNAVSKSVCINANPGCTYRPFLPILVAPPGLSGAGAPSATYAKDRVAETCSATSSTASVAVVDACAGALASETSTDVAVRRGACMAAGACTYVEQVHAHCDATTSKTVNFPQEDGTLIVKHSATADSRYDNMKWFSGATGAYAGIPSNNTRLRTLLDGDIYLGTENSDLIRFPGQIDHEITYTSNSVILGATPLHFGSSTYGTTQVGESCTALYATQCANADIGGDTSSSQTNCLSVYIPGSTDPACTYTPENVGVTAESCNATATSACTSGYRTCLQPSTCNSRTRTESSCPQRVSTLH